MTTRIQRPILVLGASGMLGRAMVSVLRATGHPFIALQRSQLDYTDPKLLRQALSTGFSWVINCAGYTDVDGAETDLTTAMALNAHFVGRLASLCREFDTAVVHFSSDYVFDGQAQSPYPQHHPVNPISNYGRSKAAGERLLIDSGCRYLLIRTSWLFADHGTNFLRTILRLLQEKKELKVVADQFGRPTCVYDLARASLALLLQDQQGLHHIANAGSCSWWEFAHAIRESAKAQCEVHPCTTREFPRPAARPAYSVLDTTLTERVIGTLPSWRTCVEKTVRQILRAQAAERLFCNQFINHQGNSQLEPIL